MAPWSRCLIPGPYFLTGVILKNAHSSIRHIELHTFCFRNYLLWTQFYGLQIFIRQYYMPLKILVLYLDESKVLRHILYLYISKYKVFGQLTNVTSSALDLHLILCSVSMDVLLTIWLLSGICMQCLDSIRQGSWLYFVVYLLIWTSLPLFYLSLWHARCWWAA